MNLWGMVTGGSRRKEAGLGRELVKGRLPWMCIEWQGAAENTGACSNVTQWVLKVNSPGMCEVGVYDAGGKVCIGE